MSRIKGSYIVEKIYVVLFSVLCFKMLAPICRRDDGISRRRGKRMTENSLGKEKLLKSFAFPWD
jgi:hypothetical protein